MKTAKELYPDNFESCYDAPSNYDPILESFEGEIVIKVDDYDWQGDSRLLYKYDNGGYGYLLFGWGSCSGCDALQACNSFEQVDELIRELHDDIIRFDTKAEALKYFKEHDWKGDYTTNSEEHAQFVSDVIKYLEEAGL